MSENSKTLYLIDGANYIYRAYYAVRPLSNSKGLPTNALYGFTQMLLRLLREENPDHMAVVFDTAEPTFRDEIYENYKATRPPPPEDLVEQFPYFKPLLEALNVPVMELAGYEADDLIGTIAKKLSSKNLNVVILSGDKDLMQLVGGHVSIYDSMKERRIGEKEVRAQFGVPPDKVVDVLGLAGDASDNIPGVKGIGPATAAKLIEQYGSVENVIKHVGELSKGLAEKIKNDKENARLSKTLATIKRDVPIDFDIDDFERRQPDAEKILKLFRELEFTKLLSDFSPKAAIGKENYVLIQSEDALAGLTHEIKKAGRMSVDLETTSLDVREAEIVGISAAVSSGTAYYIPVGHVNEKGDAQKGLFGDAKLLPGQINISSALSLIQSVLADANIKKIGQNLKYDLAILMRYGVDVKGIFCDTMVASYVLNPEGRHNLNDMALTQLGHRMITYEDVVGKGKKEKCFSEVPIETARDYSCEDADMTLRLADLFLPRLKEAGLDSLFFELEMPLLTVLLAMETAGVKIDTQKLKKLSAALNERLKKLEKAIHKTAGCEFNINSPRQLGGVLFENLKLSPPKKTKTGYSTDVGVLEDLALEHEIASLVLEYRSLSKLKSTYCDALPDLVNEKTGRVHTSFNQTVAATGRLSSSNPNLQNIPIRTEDGRQIREAFVAEGGCVLVCADYSQIELRVLAHLSGDASLLDAFRNGVDIHTMTAAGIFGMDPKKVDSDKRAVGKTVNFATIYGQGPFGLSRQLKIEIDEAKKYIDAYFLRYPEVMIYREKVLSMARKTGFVETMFGRKRSVADINSKNNSVKQMTERMAFNTVFQGTAADIIKKAMVSIHREMPKKFPKSRLIIQVHDELIFEAQKDEAKTLALFAKEQMENAVSLEVPLIVDVGTGENWSKAH